VALPSRKGVRKKGEVLLPLQKATLPPKELEKLKRAKNGLRRFKEKR